MSYPYKQQLIQAHREFKTGTITQQQYNQTERKIIREMKEDNRQRYGFALKNEKL